MLAMRWPARVGWKEIYYIGYLYVYVPRSGFMYWTGTWMSSTARDDNEDVSANTVEAIYYYYYLDNMVHLESVTQA